MSFATSREGLPWDNRRRSIVLTALISLLFCLDSSRSASAGGLFTVPPCRLLDTRQSSAFVSGTQNNLQVTSKCGIPAGAEAIVVNVTVTAPTGAGYLTVFPPDQPRPLVSSVNFQAGQTRNNASILTLAANGLLGIVAGIPGGGSAHVILDVTGYFSEQPSASDTAEGPFFYQPMAACRLADTRADSSLQGGAIRLFAAQGRCDIPNGAGALAGRVTAVSPTAAGFLGTFAGDTAWPQTTDLNFTPASAVVGNTIIPQLGKTLGQDLAVYYGAASTSTTDATIDATGYFGSEGRMGYTSITPCRALDTRDPSQGSSPLSSGVERAIGVRAQCGLPPTAVAVAANLTVVAPTGYGYLVAYPTGSPMPGTSMANFNAGEPALVSGNLIGLGSAPADLSVTAVMAGVPQPTTAFIVDVYGYFSDISPKGTEQGESATTSGLSDQRGFVNGAMQPYGDIDNVNLLNGNLTLRLPIGSRYPVSSNLSYGLALTYDSKIIDYKEHSKQLPSGNINYFAEGLPNRLSNAGVGWTLSLGGRILGPREEDNPTNLLSPDAGPAYWIYIGEDGTSHSFYPLLNAYDNGSVGQQQAGYSYTRDGSYLRMHDVDSNHIDIEFPNGEVRSFTYQSQVSGGGLAEPHWLLSSIHDRYVGAHGPANLVSVTYSANSWTITDSQGRQQVVTFRTDPVNLTSVYPALVDSVTVTAFKSSPVTYRFVYSTIAINHGPQDSWSTSSTIEVPVLTSIQLPDHSLFQFAYDTDSSIANVSSGMLTLATLPTRGSIAWTYQDYTIPVPACSPRIWLNQSAGVATRTLYSTPNGAAAGAVSIGQWTYQPGQSAALPGVGCNDQTTGFSPWEEATNTVVSPLGQKTIHYFSVLPRPEGYNQPATAFDYHDYGLPFTRNAHGSSAAPGPQYFLSSQVFDCTAGPCALTESHYVAFQRDAALVTKGPLFVDDHTDLQRRLQDEATVYERDGRASVETTRDRFDGLGHYRSQTIDQQGFQGPTSRTSFTGLNPSGSLYPEYAINPATDAFVSSPQGAARIPSTGGPWLLALYDRQRTDDLEGGRTQSHEELSCFEASSGFRLGRQILTTPGSAGTKDVMILTSRDIYGNLQEERSYGADPGLPAGISLCGTAPGGPQFDVVHTYQGGVLASSQRLGAGLTFKSLDLDIDVPSGLPLRSRDTAGLATDFSYDSMGRLIWSMPGASDPAGSVRDAWVETQYQPANQAGTCDITRSTATCTNGGTPGCASVHQFEHQTGSMAGAVLKETWQFLDSLGRTARVCEKQADNSWREVLQLRNATGQTVFTSTAMPGAIFDPSHGTVYSQFDYRGRPGLIVPPDGAAHQIKMNYYNGVRQVSRSVPIANHAGPEELSTTVQQYDLLGRLQEVVQPDPDPTTPPTQTDYAYDAVNHLTQVATLWRQNSTQYQSFIYDGLGFLRSESVPEAHLTFSNYDAKGHARRSNDGGNDLTHSYDAAGRLTSVTSTSTGLPVKNFTYDNANGSGNGKVATAVRYNYLSPNNAQIVSTYSYTGRQGRLSDRTTHLIFNGKDDPTAETFAQHFSWNDLGQEDRISYPTCTFPACSSANSARAIDRSFSNGHLTAVNGYASFTYNPNGTTRLVQFNDGEVWQQDPDPANLHRPAFICKRSSSENLSQPCSSGIGPYSYDGLGDVKQIGGESYLYDLAGRLTTATLGTGDFQSYSYDGFGNILSILSNRSSLSRNTPTSQTNNQLQGAVTYDASGNLTSWNGAAYTFDALNQMSHMTSGSQDWWYLYDADEMRIAANSAATSAHPRLDHWWLRDLSGALMREFSATSWVWSWQRDYIYRGSTLLATEAPAPEGTGRVFVDHLGTPRITTSGNGAVGHSYFAFGEESTASTDTVSVGFTGQQRDRNDPTSPADDLYYFTSRFYNPQLGRFLSVDHESAMNHYSYVENRPLTFVDPTGQSAALDLEQVHNDLYTPGEEWALFPDIGGPFYDRITVIDTTPPQATAEEAAASQAADARRRSDDEKILASWGVLSVSELAASRMGKSTYKYTPVPRDEWEIGAFEALAVPADYFNDPIFGYGSEKQRAFLELKGEVFEAITAANHEVYEGELGTTGVHFDRYRVNGSPIGSRPLTEEDTTRIFAGKLPEGSAPKP
jgi:RHS repeat-associated protein